MKSNYFSTFLILILITAGIVSCNTGRKRAHDSAAETGIEITSEEVTGLQDPAERAFFNNLALYCGQSFEGEQLFMAPGRESWAEKEMIMYVSICESSRINISLHLDEDVSRTWMFTEENGKLRFRHDHRHEDGTPEDITMYGGYADGNGTPLKQSFPADEYTCELIPTSCNAIWVVEMTERPATFTYSLFNGEELIFKAEFDLDNYIFR